jgi:hypothetical protein
MCECFRAFVPGPPQLTSNDLKSSVCKCCYEGRHGENVALNAIVTGKMDQSIDFTKILFASSKNDKKINTERNLRVHVRPTERDARNLFLL